MKSIVDVCCGSRMFWFDKKDQRAVYCDRRKEQHILKDKTAKTGERILDVNPDLQCDFTNLPFKDNSFQVVVFDPPHLIGNGKSGWLAKKYGKLDQSWREDICNGFLECFRVLNSGGTLIFKWNETDIPVSEILKLTPHTPIVGNRCGKLNKSHWLVFLKN